MQYYYPMALVVVSVTFYNICQKSTPSSLNPYAALMVAYLIALVISAALYFANGADKSVIAAFKGVNWTSVVLGITIVGIELGYLLLYRAGWSMNIGSLVASITIAIVLIGVGRLLYSETLTASQIMGVILCIGGLVFLNK